MLKWSFAASRWLVQIAFGAVSVFFFLLVAKLARIMAFPVFLFIHWAYQKKKDMAFFFADSEHSYDNYLHILSSHILSTHSLHTFSPHILSTHSLYGERFFSNSDSL